MFFVCGKCDAAYDLGFEPTTPCPECGGVLVTHKGLEQFLLHRAVSAKRMELAEFVSSGLGFGRREEHIPPEAVLALLQSKRIVQVEHRQAGNPPRMIVESLLLENGMRLHFASSIHGATIYKGTRDEQRSAAA